MQILWRRQDLVCLRINLPKHMKEAAGPRIAGKITKAIRGLEARNRASYRRYSFDD